MTQNCEIITKLLKKCCAFLSILLYLYCQESFINEILPGDFSKGGAAMKKFISILLILGLVATTLTGCITEVGGASDPLSYDTEQPDISEEDVASELDTEEPASDMNDETDSSDDVSKWMESIDDSSWADDSDVSNTDGSDGSDDSSDSATTITEDDLPTVSEEVSEEETTVSENIGLNALA